jgi:hypothetical protein
MCDPHKIVINNICEMIGWETIVFYDNLVINYIIFKLDFPMNQVFELSFSFGYFHSNNERLLVCLFLSNLFCIVALDAKPIIHRLCIFLTAYLNSHLLESLSSTKAGICVTVLYTRYIFNWKFLLPLIKSLQIYRRSLDALIKCMGL